MRYFFHIRTDEALILDDEGQECSNLRAAQAEAFYSICDIARTTPFKTSAVEIADCTGRTIQLVSMPLTRH